jgi:hypothetical protein
MSLISGSVCNITASNPPTTKMLTCPWNWTTFFECSPAHSPLFFLSHRNYPMHPTLVSSYFALFSLEYAWNKWHITPPNITPPVTTPPRTIPGHHSNILGISYLQLRPVARPWGVWGSNPHFPQEPLMGFVQNRRKICGWLPPPPQTLSTFD